MSKFAIVTCAGSGVGHAITVGLVSRRWTVGLIGRRADAPLAFTETKNVFISTT